MIELRTPLELLSEGSKGEPGFRAACVRLCLSGFTYYSASLRMTRLAVLVCAWVSACAESRATGRLGGARWQRSR